MAIFGSGSLAAAMLLMQAENVAPSESPVASDAVLPVLTPVQIEIMATMNSQASKAGEEFPIRLASPIAIPDGPTLPAGTPGIGQVVHAAKSRFGGKAGELILAVRYLDFEGVRIPLRSLRFPVSTKALDNSDTATIVSMAASPVGLFITGGEVNIPAGTVAYAKTSAPVTFVTARAAEPILQKEEQP